MKTQTAFRLDSDILSALKDLSKDGRPMSWHVDKALRAYLKPDKKAPAKKRFDPVAEYSSELKLHQSAWVAWCDKRKELKKPLTETAAKEQVKMLIKHDQETQRQIIWNSIKNDYQGLFEPKVKGNERKLSLSERSAAATQRLLENGENALDLLGSDDPFIRSQVAIEGRRLPDKR